MTSAAHRTSLSADGPQPAHVRPKSIHDYDGLSQPPHVSRLKAAARREAQVEPLTIEVEDGPDGFLHLPLARL
ncbi:hypothetical protein VTK73DRAFT_1802 [Phialemonium thermophilum]|uniref:Uncharacterized protein n=1 Tax=Phialemonium thermophilum TaxID=223376 RepID=A0ABR3VT15_9PEZI